MLQIRRSVDGRKNGTARESTYPRPPGNHRAPSADFYTASKAAVLGITWHLARELAQFNINVNAVCPGSIDTPMVRSNSTPEKLRAGIEKIPWGRLGRPEEVADFVLFLASDASSYITGASIDINGGELMI